MATQNQKESNPMIRKLLCLVAILMSRYVPEGNLMSLSHYNQHIGHKSLRVSCDWDEPRGDMV